MAVTRKMFAAAVEAASLELAGTGRYGVVSTSDGVLNILTGKGENINLGPAVLAAIVAAHRRFKCTPATPARSANTNTSSRATGKTKRARTSSTSTR